MVKKLKTTFDKWLADPEIKKHFDKDFVLSELTAEKKVKKLLKAIKKKPKRLNCVATEKCQINFEQR
jgi:hypothetical protein